MKRITLSKSRFISGLQCPKLLYIEVRHPELLPPPDPSLEALFDQVHQVGLLATKLYPSGRMVEWGERGYKGAVKETEKLLNDPKIPAIFEAAFEVDGLRIKADILLRNSGCEREMADCIITPDLAGATYLRFSKRKELIDLGRRATLNQLNQIRSALGN